MKGAAEFPIVNAAAAAIGIHPLNLEQVQPTRARKLARQAAILHEQRRENAARALAALEAFDNVLEAAAINVETVQGAFTRRGGVR